MSLECRKNRHLLLHTPDLEHSSLTLCVASIHASEIPSMRIKINREPSLIALQQVDRPIVHLNISSIDILIVRLADIVLRRDMNISHRKQWKLRYRVIQVRDAKVTTRLIRNVAADLGSSDSRRAKVI